MTNDEVKELRKKLGLNQEEMGKHLGITASGVSKIESGKNPINGSILLHLERLKASYKTQV